MMVSSPKFPIEGNLGSETLELDRTRVPDLESSASGFRGVRAPACLYRDGSLSRHGCGRVTLYLAEDTSRPLPCGLCSALDLSCSPISRRTAG